MDELQAAARGLEWIESPPLDGDGDGAAAGPVPRSCPPLRIALVSASCVPIRAPDGVRREALLEAHRRLVRAWGRLPNALARMRALGVECHIIPADRPSSSLPSHAHMWSSADEQHRRDFDERTRGTGGAFCSVGEENLLCTSEDARVRLSDPRYGGRDILAHESAHTLMDLGLDDAQRRRIRAAFVESVEEQGRWTRASGERAYAGTNESEYFAELTMWYFGSRGEYVDAEVPASGREALRAYDPRGCELLESIYSGSVDPTIAPRVHWHEYRADRVDPARRGRGGRAALELRSRRHGAPADGAQGAAVNLMFVNRTAHDLVLSWADESASAAAEEEDEDEEEDEEDEDEDEEDVPPFRGRMRFATITRGGGHWLQRTFSNHLWLLERLRDDAEPSLEEEGGWSCFAPPQGHGKVVIE